MLYKKIKNIFLTMQFNKFIFVGIFCAFLHWSSRIILSEHFSLHAALISSYLFAMFTAFILNKFFVFKSKAWPILEMVKFLFINILFLPVVYFLTIYLNSIFKFYGIFYPDTIAHLVALSVPLFLTFIFYKFIVFK